MDLTTASITDFNPLLEQTFTAQDAADLTLTLVRVDALTQQPDSPRQPFALVFRADGGQLLEQRIYQLHHSSTGTLTIFLVPIEQTAEASFYEAVFN